VFESRSARGDDHWKAEIIIQTWYQAETGRIPISGAGYGGPAGGRTDRAGVLQSAPGLLRADTGRLARCTWVCEENKCLFGIPVQALLAVGNVYHKVEVQPLAQWGARRDCRF
jgi:hypothetical protein